MLVIYNTVSLMQIHFFTSCLTWEIEGFQNQKQSSGLGLFVKLVDLPQKSVQEDKNNTTKPKAFLQDAWEQI